MIGVDMGDGTILVVRDRLLTGSEPPVTTYELAIDRLSAQLAEYKKLEEPGAVHVNILQGKLKLSREEALHIAGATDYDRLKQQIAEANASAEAWQDNCHLTERELERERDRHAETIGRLAEANKNIEVLSQNIGVCGILQAQLAERDREIARLREKVLWPPNPSTWTVIRITELNKLEAENAALRAEVERLTERLQANAAKIDEEDVVIEWADYLELKAEARKQTAQECYKMVCSDEYVFGARNLAKAIKSKFGLEG